MPRAKVVNPLALDADERVLPSLEAVLRSALSPASYALLMAIVEEAEQARIPVYLVGGFVRDLMLDRSSLDLDVVFEGKAISLGRKLAARLGGKLVTHKEFGTAVWWLPEDRRELLGRLGLKPSAKAAKSLPESIDLITARRESYTAPAALPTVEFDDLSADQARRDFSINTMALRLDGVMAGLFLDPWFGRQDLKKGLLRTLHYKSFVDDPTRILRILRFAGRLGFKLGERTNIQLEQGLGGIQLLSGDRVRHELRLALLEPERVKILRAMQQRGVLASISPGLDFPASAAALLKDEHGHPAPKAWTLEDLAPSDLAFTLWLMPLPPEVAVEVAKRLRFDAGLREAVIGASRLYNDRKALVEMATSQLVARLESEPRLAAYALYLATKDQTLGDRLRKFTAKWRHTRAYTDGNVLQQRGLKPGPAYKRILGRLRAAWLDGEVRTAEQEQALLERLLGDQP